MSMEHATGKYAELREAALRVVEGRSDGLDRTFMSDVLKALQERSQLLEALTRVMAYEDIRKYIGSDLGAVADAALSKALGEQQA